MMISKIQVNKPEKTIKGAGKFATNSAKYNRYLVDYLVSGQDKDRLELISVRQEILNYLNFVKALIEDEEIIKKLSKVD